MDVAWLLVLLALGWFALQIAKGYSARSGPQREHEQGPYTVAVVGESHYQDALEAICGGRTRDGAEKEVRAILVLEDSNPYDKYAVRVDVDGQAVGYLDRKAAKTYRRRFKARSVLQQKIKCAGVIRGGWDRGGSDTGYFGVWLQIPF